MAEEGNAPSYFELSRRLESPFLDQELFARQDAEERQAHLGALEAESVFLDAFAQPWAHPSLGEAGIAERPEDTLVSPDEPVLSEYEEWRTPLVSAEDFEGETAEPGYEYETVPETLPADALVSDKAAKRYFETFPRLGDLLIRKATVLTPHNFESLMDHLLASEQRSFVIDAHGDPSGLTMHLANGTEISAAKQSLFFLRGIEHVRGLMRLANESKTIWQRASGADLDSWQRIVEVIHSETWRAMVKTKEGDTWPPAPRVPDVDAARKLVQSRLASLVNALFPKAANKQARVDTLIRKMLQLQARNIREIQFRACNIGKDPATLAEFRRFFGADHLCAPDVRTGMGSVDPGIGPAAVNRLARQRLAQVYQLSGGRFAISINVLDHTFKAACAADSQAAVGEWVASHLMANSGYRRGTLPIHFLLTQPCAFALDSDYAEHIKCRSSFWEGAIRAHELEELEALQGAGDETETEDETEAERTWALEERFADRALESEEYPEPLMEDLVPRVPGSDLQTEDETETALEAVPADQVLELEEYPEPLMEELVPKVSGLDLRKRIDDYLFLAETEYTFPDGTKVRARPQFRMSDSNSETAAEKIEDLFQRNLGAGVSRPLHTVIRCAAYGRARPDEIRVITQHLIDLGELNALRADRPLFSNNQLVRALQQKFMIGVDCAGYVQLAFIYAFTGKSDDARCNLPVSERRKDLGLRVKRSNENLTDLPATHFDEVGFLKGQTGDLFVLLPPAGETVPHTVIVVNHTVALDHTVAPAKVGVFHIYLVDASWGRLYPGPLYEWDYAGVARRELVYHEQTGNWWDVHPRSKRWVNKNPIGPYNGHPIRGMYRAKEK